MEEYTQILNEQTFAINTVWVALCAALIFFMEAGFALLEAGFVRADTPAAAVARPAKCGGRALPQRIGGRADSLAGRQSKSFGAKTASLTLLSLSKLSPASRLAK